MFALLALATGCDSNSEPVDLDSLHCIDFLSPFPTERCPGLTSDTVATTDMAIEILVVHDEESEEMWVTARLLRHEDESGARRGSRVDLSETDRVEIREVVDGVDRSPDRVSALRDGVEVSFTNSEVPARYRIELIRDGGRISATNTVVDVLGVLSTIGPREGTAYRLADEVPFAWAVVDSAGLEVAQVPVSGVTANEYCGPDAFPLTLDFVDDAEGGSAATIPASRFVTADSGEPFPCRVRARLTDSTNPSGEIVLPAVSSIDTRFANARAPGVYEVSASSLPRPTTIEIRE